MMFRRILRNSFRDPGFDPLQHLFTTFDIRYYNLLGVGDAGQGVLLLALRTLKTSGVEEEGHA